MRSCRPTRGPTSKPVLVGATTASSIERAGRRLRPEKKPVRAGASPAGQSSNGTVDVASPEGVGRRRRPCGGVRRSATYTTRRAPAGADVLVVRPARRESVSRKSTARVSSPATAAASPLVLPGWLSGGLRSARSRCPTSSRSALARVQQTSAPSSAGGQRQRLRHRGGCVTPGAAVPASTPS